MSAPVEWQNNTVDVRARLIPRILWTTASIDVFVGGQCVLQTGGQMKFNGGCSATFFHSGATHTAQLSWGTGWLLWFPYKLQIDSTPISEGRVYVRNWPLSFIAPLALIAVAWLIHHF